MESYEKIKKVLALGFMNFLDENTPKDKMCLSNGECVDIEKAFNEQDWPRLAGYLDKYTESEDERIRKAVVSLVYEMKGTYQSFAKVELDKMVAWLENQKDQKPAWSEEGEAIINVLRLAVVNSGEVLFRKHEITKQECIDFVNSLRPSWKPSEEQMDALMDAINDSIMQYDYHGSPLKEEVTRIYSENLQSLYKDLKKL